MPKLAPAPVTGTAQVLALAAYRGKCRIARLTWTLGRCRFRRLRVRRVLLSCVFDEASEPSEKPVFPPGFSRAERVELV